MSGNMEYQKAFELKLYVRFFTGESRIDNSGSNMTTRFKI